MAFMDRTRDYWDTLRRQRFGSRPNLMTPDPRGQQQPEPAWRQSGQKADMGVSNILQGMKQPWNRWQGNAVQPTPPPQGLVGSPELESKIRVPEQKGSPGLLKRIGAATASGGGAMAEAASRPGASFWEALGAFGQPFSETYTENERYRAEQEQEAREEARIIEDRGIAAAERQRLTTARTGLEEAVSSIGETGGLTPTQLQQVRQISLTDPNAAISLANQYERTNKTGTYTGNFIESLDPAYLELMKDSGQLDLLNAPDSVFGTDQKLDLMLTHGTEIRRRANAIDPLLERIYNIDDRNDATPEQLEHVKHISENPEYTELQLRSPINWQVIDTGPGGVVRYMRDDQIQFTLPRSDPQLDSGLLDAYDTDFDEWDGAGGRMALYQWKRGLEALENIPEDAFGQRGGALRKAWTYYRTQIDEGQDRNAALADLEHAWAALGFENLSAFVGPTSDYEFGIAQALSGDTALTKASLKKHMETLYRQKLGRLALHNTRVIRDLPDEIHERYLVRLAPEDFYEPIRQYYQDQIGTNLSSRGHEVMLDGTQSWTGAVQEWFGPEDVVKPGIGPSGDWRRTGNESSGFLNNQWEWELVDPNDGQPVLDSAGNPVREWRDRNR